MSEIIDVQGGAITKGESSLLLEKQSQIGNALAVQSAKLTNEIAGINLKTLGIKKERANVKLETEKVGLEIDKTNLEKTKIELEIAKDNYAFAKFSRNTNREQLIVKANKMLVDLEASKLELNEAKELYQLKFRSFRPQLISQL